MSIFTATTHSVIQETLEILVSDVQTTVATRIGQLVKTISPTISPPSMMNGL